MGVRIRFGRGHEIPLDSRHALQRARQHLHCIFVTGKNRQSVAGLGLENATGVFQNGAVAFLGGSKIFERVVAQDVRPYDADEFDTKRDERN